MTSIYTRCVTNLLFPLHERLKGHDSVRVRRALEATQWWSADKLAALQTQRLRDLLMHVGTHVPYYRDLFHTLAFEPSSAKSTADLAHLPFLTKTIIRAETDRLKSDKATDLARFNTGGSSGEPLVFFIGKERVTHDVAAKWRATRWWGVDIGDPEIVAWGSPSELGAQDRVRQWRDRGIRTKLFPAFEKSEAKLDGFVAEIRAMRPKMLFGYPSALSHIARHAEKRGQRMNDLGIEVAFVTSERLYDDQRKAISRIFGCRVANGYGGRDAGFIAHDCPQGGMHITSEDIIVEVVDPEGRPVAKGAAGELVITHLATRDFPFIRYRTGDIGVLDTKPCACGRGLPLLKEIQGRTTDFVVARDGTVMHGLALVYVIRDLPGIAAFKIVQESLDLTKVMVVSGPGFVQENLTKIKTGLGARLGEGVQVDVDLVPELAPERSGKFRYVISRVAPAPTA